MVEIREEKKVTSKCHSIQEINKFSQKIFLEVPLDLHCNALLTLNPVDINVNDKKTSSASWIHTRKLIIPIFYIVI